MTEKRMFSRSLCESDGFLEMSPISQSLYFHLLLNTDDDGFCDSPRAIMRSVKAKQLHLEQLEKNGFIYVFDDNVVAIRHFLMQNRMRNDRYHETKYKEHRDDLMIDSCGVYTKKESSNDKENRHFLATEKSQEENNIDIDSLSKAKSDVKEEKNPTDRKPTLEDVKIIADSLKIDENTYQKFFYYYDSRDWKIGGVKINNLTSVLKSWALKEDSFKPKHSKKAQNIADQSFEIDDFMSAALKKTYGELNDNLHL